MADNMPKHLDHYELLEVVEETATGNVYRARDTTNDEEILLKVLRGATGTTSPQQPRYYEMPSHHAGPAYAHPYPTYAPPRTGMHPSTIIAFILAIVLVGVCGFMVGTRFPVNGDGVRAPGQLSKVPDALRQDMAQRDANAPELTPTRTDDKDALAEKAASEALMSARAEWQGLRLRGDFEAAAIAFVAVSTQHAGTNAAKEARRMTGLVYHEWGLNLERMRDYAAASEKLMDAIQYLPSEDPMAEQIKKRLPALALKSATAARTEGEPTEALDLLDQALRLTVNDDQRAEIRLERARLLWQEMDEHAHAYSEASDIIQQFPDTVAAATAKTMAPKILETGARRYLEAKEYDRARELAQQLLEDHPATSEGRRAADLDAEALYRIFSEAERTDTEYTQSYNELFNRYPASQWTLSALRRRMGRRDSDVPLADNIVQSRIDRAGEYRSEKAYNDALSQLRYVVQNALPGSDLEERALGLIPQWYSEAILHYAGTGERREAEKNAEELKDLFPHTDWCQHAQDYLYGIRNVPEGMVFVPAGGFTMGTRNEDVDQLLKASPRWQDTNLAERDMDVLLRETNLLREMPQHIAQTGAYYIDATEVTNKQYKTFLNETSQHAPPHWVKGSYPAGTEMMPVTGVTLIDANAYAKWRGARLPTGAEWEKAARGTDGRLFPWGNTWDRQRARHMVEVGAGPLPVGSHPNGTSPYGCLDMIGNVAEWTVSKLTPYDGSPFKPTPMEADLAVLRGGQWDYAGLSGGVIAHCASRDAVEPDAALSRIGFRCVVDFKGSPTDGGRATQGE